MPFVGSDLWKVRQKWGNGPLVWPGVTVLVFNENKELWLGKRDDNDKWSVCGGHYELGDNAEECARREIREELGTEVQDIQMFGVLTDVKITTVTHVNGDVVQSPSHIFVAHVRAADVKNGDEHSAFKWVKFEEAEKEMSNLFGYSGFAVRAHKRWKQTGEFQIG